MVAGSKVAGAIGREGAEEEEGQVRRWRRRRRSRWGVAARGWP